MPKVHHVKKARRPLPAHGIAIGDSYFWWARRSPGQGAGRRFYSKTYPRRSAITGSEFWARVYAIQESFDVSSTALDELESERDSVLADIRDLAQEQEDKKSNLPEQLQDAGTGTLLQERYDACEAWAEALEQVNIPNEADEDELQTARDELTNAVEEGPSTS